MLTALLQVIKNKCMEDKWMLLNESLPLVFSEWNCDVLCTFCRISGAVFVDLNWFIHNLPVSSSCPEDFIT